MSESTKHLRLQKFIAQAGLASRRHAEQLITDGRVKVNGSVVKELGTKVDPEMDVVLVDGKPAVREELKLYRFHKPAGVITTLDDEQGRKSVADFVSHLPVRVFPVGRLDVDVVGLLLLTNDGELAESLLHPRNEVERVYRAYVRGADQNKFIDRILGGLMITDEPSAGPKSAKRAALVSHTRDLKRLLGDCPEGCFPVEIVVCEGSKHFVKKLCLAAGCPVVRLGRVAFGDFKLGDLRRGAIEELRLETNSR